MQQQTVLTSMSHDVLGNETPFCAVTFSTDGRSLALLKQHGLSILDTNTWTEKQLTTLHSFRTVHISLSQDSKLVAAEDQIWDMGTGQSVAQFNQAIDIQFDPDASANLIAVADWYGHLGLWQLS